MMAWVEIYQLALFAGFGFAVAAALLCAPLYPLVRSRILLLPPATRANYLLAWTVAPVVVGALLAGFIFLPTVLSLLGMASDHCQGYAAGFPPPCLLHPLVAMERELPWVVFLPINALGLVFLARVVWGFLRLRRLAYALTVAGRSSASRDLWIVESQWPLAMASSVPRPRVFVSSKLVQSLSSPQLAVVLAHEQAHLCRHDPARYFIARALSCLHVPWLRRQLLEDLSLAAEQACDEEAAQQIGDRLLVADTIVQVERLFHKQSSSAFALLPSFMGNQVVSRVEALLASPQKPVPAHRVMSYACTGLVVIALMLAAEPLHQFTEAVLGLLIG